MSINDYNVREVEIGGARVRITRDFREARQALIEVRLLREILGERFQEIALGFFEEAPSFEELFTLDIRHWTAGGTLEKLFEMKPTPRLAEFLAALRAGNPVDAVGVR